MRVPIYSKQTADDYLLVYRKKGAAIYSTNTDDLDELHTENHFVHHRSASLSLEPLRCL